MNIPENRGHWVRQESV